MSGRFPALLATVEGWSGIRSFDTGREGWHGYSPEQRTVYHRLGKQPMSGTASVAVTTYGVPQPDADRTPFITETQLLQRLFWDWMDDEPYTFPIAITIERSTPRLPIDGERAPILVVECERLWIAGVQLSDIAIIAVGRHYPNADLRLQITPAGEIDGA